MTVVFYLLESLSTGQKLRSAVWFLLGILDLVGVAMAKSTGIVKFDHQDIG